MSPNTEKPLETDQPTGINPSDKMQSGNTKQQPTVPVQTAAPNLRSPALLRHALREALKELGHEL